VGIGFGQGRYRPKIDAQIAALTRRLEAAEAGMEPRGEEEAPPGQRAAIEQDLRDMRALRRLVDALLDCVPRRGATRREVVDGARRFVETAARSADRLDAYARRKLLDELEEVGEWFSRGAERPGGSAWKWIGDVAAGARVLGSGPRPGCLHVDSVDRGGHSGRPFTFILGLDDARFPGSGIPDPLLLDRERRRLSEEIPRAADRLERRIEDFGRLLARLRGTVTLSYPCRDLIEDRERFPAPVLLAVFRALTGDPDGDPGAFARWLPPPASFAPGTPAACLDGDDWWLWRMTGPDRVEGPERLLLGRHTHLAAGREAAAARGSERFTPWDGCVPEAGADLDPTADAGPVMSANRFEALGRCPLRWFFAYGLEIAPPDETAVDPARWLDPLARGSLLHEVFEAFLRGAIEEAGRGAREATGGLIDPDRDRGRLLGLLEDRVRAYVDLYPPPSESVYRAEKGELERAARLFLVEEARHLRRTARVPRFLEASLGMPPAGAGSGLDVGEPIPLPLPGGGTLRVRGRIDRVDEIVRVDGDGRAARVDGTGRYVVLDYKTGSDWGYERTDPFRKGRRAQPWLYVEMVRRALRERVAADARVEGFGYFFPGTRPAGARYEWADEDLAEGGGIVEALCRLVAAGAFPATDDAGADCTFCDYRPVCGDVEAVAAASARKMDGPGNAVLEPFRRLRRGGDGERGGTR
jgi:ATP-dependent helicase/nuclease subunit B